MNLEALKALAAKVESGELLPMDIAISAFHVGAEITQRRSLVAGSYHGSLDDAKSLHDAVLPDTGWNIQWTMKYPHLMGDGNPFVARIGWGEIFAASGPNPARAWLLAILRALISQEESNG